jgi:tRNA nucleotidyltransferase (CCA-adding enzyme)
VPRESRELADVVAREHGNIHRSETLGPAALVRLLERCDAFRRPERFEQVLLACECDARGRLGHGDSAYPQRPRLLATLEGARSVNTQAVVDGMVPRADGGAPGGTQIAQAIHTARVDAVKHTIGPAASA